MGHEYYKIQDRQTLRRLDNGIEITRAMKHEPINFASLSPRELANLTDDYSGSKFLAAWQLPRLVDWISEQVAANGWQFPPGAKTRIRVQLSDPVGYVKGCLVHTITVRISGRWVHAYPDED